MKSLKIVHEKLKMQHTNTHASQIRHWIIMKRVENHITSKILDSDSNFKQLNIDQVKPLKTNLIPSHARNQQLTNKITITEDFYRFLNCQKHRFAFFTVLISSHGIEPISANNWFKKYRLAAAVIHVNTHVHNTQSAFGKNKYYK